MPQDMQALDLLLNEFKWHNSQDKGMAKSIAKAYAEKILKDHDKIRMQYSGMAGLIAELHLRLDNHTEYDEDRQMILNALNDWSKITGYSVRQILNRIELIPPSSEITTT